MNNLNQNSDPLKDLMKRHKTPKPSDDFTSKVMNMVKSGVILEEDTEPFIKWHHVAAAIVVFAGLLAATFFFDAKIFSAEALQNMAVVSQINEIFSQYQQITGSFANLFSKLVGNEILVISVFTIVLLLGLDKLFRKKTGHAMILV